MVDIIQEQRNPKFADQLMQGLSNVSRTSATEIPRFFGERLMQAEKAKQQALENEQLNQLLGQDISGIQDSDIKKEIVKNLLQSNVKKTQAAAPLQAGLATIHRMRELGSRGRLGKTITRGLLGGEEAKERGEYEQLGKSLISLATTIPIRNRIEFETLAGKLYDPSIRDKEREGILDAMERIISQNLQQFGDAHEMQSSVSQQKKRSLEEIFG